MRIDISIEIPVENTAICTSILNAVEPDNVDAPKGMSIRVLCKNSTAYVYIASEDISILTVRNTVDDILAHIGLALKTLRIEIEDKG